MKGERKRRKKKKERIEEEEKEERIDRKSGQRIPFSFNLVIGFNFTIQNGNFQNFNYIASN